ncbi:MAG: hypothetical protein JSR87_01415 [Proteobacteria bacterium]|nr:hypothetical protein [Pseudomonadota bacterium]MBS0572184.1 hypothetical protein [Pseudomonadota bacterium]
MQARLIPILAGLFLALMAAFLGGMWTTHANWWAWQTMDDARQMWHSWRSTGMLLRDMTYSHRAPGAADVEYRVTDPGALAKGSLLILRLDAATQHSRAELIDPAGKVLHTWPVDYARLYKGGASDEFPHASALLPDGSLLVSFDDGKALARLDACGNPAWVRNDMVFHHSISQGQDGYWAWADPDWDGGQDQRMVRFDPETGKTLESISLLDDVVPASASTRLALTFPEGFKFLRKADKTADVDILHPNDIDELTPDLAPAFPEFKVGDLLVSMRNINMLAVIDRTSHVIKWAQYGPWRDQHDPDFQADGTISVLSNNMERNRSTILEIDPRTNAVHDVFQGTDFWFNTFIMGKHESLPNGNWLIASAMEGRVIEVTPAGKVVREFNNIINATFNSVISSALFVPDGYLKSLPVCQK